MGVWEREYEGMAEWEYGAHSAYSLKACGEVEVRTSIRRVERAGSGWGRGCGLLNDL